VVGKEGEGGERGRKEDYGEIVVMERDLPRMVKLRGEKRKRKRGREGEGEEHGEEDFVPTNYNPEVGPSLASPSASPPSTSSPLGGRWWCS
jgi:hypothetical protein